MIEAALAGLAGLVIVLCVIAVIFLTIHLVMEHPPWGLLLLFIVLWGVVSLGIYGKQQQRQELFETCAA